MSRIPFNTPIRITIPVTEQKAKKSKFFTNALNFVDSYFSWTKECYVYSGKKSLSGRRIVNVSTKEIISDSQTKAIKILSYATLIIPIIMIFSKIIYRRMMNFATPWMDKYGHLNCTINPNTLNLKPSAIPIPNPPEDIYLSGLLGYAESLEISE